MSEPKVFIEQAQQSIESKITAFMETLSSHERVLILSNLSLEQLEALGSDIQTVKETKAEDATIKAEELIEANGGDINAVAALLGLDLQGTKAAQKAEPKPENPTSEKKKAPRATVQSWMEVELLKDSTLKASHFTNRFAEQFSGHLQPPYNTLYTWTTTVKKKLNIA